MKPTPEDSLPAAKPIRLQRYLAQCGLGSRRECEELISGGRIEIDGRPVTELGSTVDPGRQQVTLDGERLKVERKKYYLLNKPPGYLCTAKDPAGRPVVLDLFPNQGPRLFTVGRLDENTTGLLIVTNDGDLAQKLAHPRYRIYRLYRAQVAGDPPREVFDQLKTGLYFTEGKFRVHDVKRAKKQGRSTWVEITMIEGQNREIRRLFARVGHKVMKLERIGFGPIRLGKIPLGEYRELRHEELQELHGILDRNERERGGRKPGTPPEAGKRRPAPERSPGDRPPAGTRSAGRPSQAGSRRKTAPAPGDRNSRSEAGKERRGPAKGRPKKRPSRTGAMAKDQARRRSYKKSSGPRRPQR